jgi:hypothetical protein
MNERHFVKTLTLENFKRFSQLHLSFQQTTVIAGANGTGKTQILWALLLFARAFNTRVSTSSNAKMSTVSLNSVPLYQLLSSPHFLGCSDYSSFLHNTSDKTTISGTTTDGIDFKFQIKVNGVFEFLLPTEQFQKKIRFALATPSFLFGYPEIFGVEDVLTTSQQNMRQLYGELSNDSKYQLTQELTYLFGIKDIRFDKKGPVLLVTEQNGTKCDVSLLGSAFQKIISILILAYTLIDFEEPIKVLLLEEPEAMLYPTLILKFFNRLYTLMSRSNIQLIVASNCHQIIDCFPKDHQIILSSQEPCLLKDGTIELSQLLGTPSNSKPILLIDGANDEAFLFQFLPTLAERFSLVSVNVPLSSRTCQLLAKCGQYVRLCDKEFFPLSLLNERVQKDQKEHAIPTFYWSFPCIESYLILHDLKNISVHEAKEKCIPYFLNCFAAKSYVDGAKQGCKEYKITDKEIASYWENATTELFEKEEPDWSIVVNVIHGHSWMKRHNKTTLDEISKFNSIDDLHKDVQKELLDVQKKLLSIFQ